LLLTLTAFILIAGVFCRARIFAEEKPVLREVWNLLIEVSRRGRCDKRYTNFLRAAALQIVSTLADDSVGYESVNAGLVVSLDLCGRLAEVVNILLPVHVVYAILKEPICSLLTSLYTTLNAIVKLLLIKQKSTDISEWKCVSELAYLARGDVLRIMESADENVGTLNPLDANLLLLSSALHDDRLDVQVRHNTIGVRDFRIDAEKLFQRLEQIGAREGLKICGLEQCTINHINNYINSAKDEMRLVQTVEHKLRLVEITIL
uniref:Uncharacterized protein n=1 Tax=Parascaris equorum TaxID=6256 RepID=A0A914RPL5_PAREQ